MGGRGAERRSGLEKGEQDPSIHSCLHVVSLSHDTVLRRDAHAADSKREGGNLPDESTHHFLGRQPRRLTRLLRVSSPDARAPRSHPSLSLSLSFTLEKSIRSSPYGALFLRTIYVVVLFLLFHHSSRPGEALDDARDCMSDLGKRTRVPSSRTTL